MAITDNLVSYWKLDESSGNASDSVGSNTGVNTGTVTYATAKINNGATLNGSSKYFKLQTTTGLDSWSDFTISAWVYLSSTWSASGSVYGYSNNIDSVGGGAYTNFFFRIRNDRKLELSFRVSGTYTFYTSVTTDTIPTETWTFVTCSRSGSIFNLYINGSIKVSESKTSGIITHTWDKAIGAAFDERWSSNVSEYFNGSLDEIGIWSRALSAGEISQLYNSGAGLQYPFTTNKPSFFPFFNQYL